MGGGDRGRLIKESRKGGGDRVLPTEEMESFEVVWRGMETGEV